MTAAILRNKTRQIMVGSVLVGGDAPISVQSMTNTDTCDVDATLKQIRQLRDAGADIVRVSIPNQSAAQAFRSIKSNFIGVPLVADIHFDHLLAIDAINYGAECVRINPGNINSKTKLNEIVAAAKDRGTSMRIGINSGSIDRSILQYYNNEPCADALVESAVASISMLYDLNFENFKVSVKASDPLMMIEAYQKLSKLTNHPLHLGVTEAGSLRSGIVKSVLGIGSLLMQGIGDTIRVSLASDPCDEVKVAYDILKSLKLRTRGINFVVCPSCARQEFDVIETIKQLENRLEDITYPLTVAVIGCVVNGPGEAKVADIGLVGGPANILYVNGEFSKKVPNAQLVDQLEQQVREYVATKLVE